jgi:deazaflavin-dependent oxidoreductase (nitroreductase family)
VASAWRARRRQPGGDGVQLGQRHHPAWYYNLRTHPTATVTVGDVSRRVRAHEATGEERDRLWQQDLEVYPGRIAYARRAANRPIPVMVLAPVPDKPS